MGRPTKLRNLRLAKGKTLDEVSKVLGISRSALTNYELGDRTPKPYIKKLIAEYYGKTVDEIFAVIPSTAVEINDRLEEMLIFAARYACGRRSYAVHDTVTYIEALISRLSTNTLKVMLNDLNTNLEMEQRAPGTKPFGDPCSKKDWMHLYSALSSELADRNNKK